MLFKVLLASSLALGVLGQKKHHHSGSASGSAAPSGSSSAAGPKVSAATSVLLYLGPQGNAGVKWEASVVNVQGCDITYGLSCTQGNACKGGISATVTEGNGLYKFSTSLATSGVTEVVTEVCSLAGTTAADCTVQITATSGSSTKTTSTASVFKGRDVAFEQVPVTAGASLLPSPGSCSMPSAAKTKSKSKGHQPASGSSSSPTTSASSSAASQMSTATSSAASTSTTSGAAMPTAVSNVYKVLVVPAAALLAFA